jgi:hypothetical protein
MQQGIDKGIEKGIEKGAIQTKQQTLEKMLRLRFTRVPAAIQKTIEATDDSGKLDVWIERFVTANSLDDVGIN